MGNHLFRKEGEVLGFPGNIFFISEVGINRKKESIKSKKTRKVKLDFRKKTITTMKKEGRNWKTQIRIKDKFNLVKSTNDRDRYSLI